MAIFPGSAIPSAVSDYEIENSLRSPHSTTSKLTRTPTVAGNRRTFTVSFWFKPANALASEGNIIRTKVDGSNYFIVGYASNDASFWIGTNFGESKSITLSRVLRDPASWYHLVVAIDTTLATEADRTKIYINGVRQTDFSSASYPTQNNQGPWNNTVEQHVASGGGDSYAFDGYLAEFYNIDGTALAADSFGELDSKTNMWKPLDSDDIKDAVTFGTNGFYQKYNSTELGASFADSGKSAVDSSDRESEIAVTSSFTWVFTSSGNTDGEDLVNGVVTNNDAGGGWMPSGNAEDRWIKFDFGSGKVYTRCQWISINSTGSEGTWKWQGSNNDSDWSDIGGTFTLGGSDGGSNATYTLGDTLSGNTTSYRYYRILGISGTVNTAGRRLAMYFGGWSDGVGHTITANGDATNQRPQPHGVTANGDAHLIGPKVGTSAIRFGGSGDYLSAPAAASDFGSGNFTIEGWYNITAKDTGGTAFMAGGATGSNGWMVEWDDSGDMYFYWHNGTSEQNPSWSWTPAYNRWYYLAIARSGSSVDFWVDGVSQGSQSMSGTISAGDGWTLGVQPGSGNYDLKGYAGPQRLSDVARYTVGSDFTPPTDVWTNDSDTTLLIQNGTDGTDTFDDLSTPDHTISHSGDVRWFAPKVGAGAMELDGTGDWFAVDDSSSFDLGGGDFTIEMWVKLRNLSPRSDFISQGVASDTTPLWQIGFRGSGDNGDGLYTDFNTSSSTTFMGIEQGNTTGWVANTWYHVCLVRYGNVWTLYKDGTSVGTTTVSGSMDSPAADILLGRWAYSESHLLDGYIDGVRISRKARYTTTFTPPTTAFTDDIDTALILNADLNQGTWNPDTSTGLAISEQSRMKFDGTGDYLTVPDSSDWAFADNDFTIEFWVYFNSIKTGHPGYGLIGQRTGSSARWSIYQSNSILNFYSNSPEFSLEGTSTTLSAGRWYHVAFVRDGNDFEFFLDGVSDGTMTDSDTMVDVAGVLGIGYNEDSGYSKLDGYMDEIRISNSARYTGTFTPQTRGNPFTADANTKLLIHSDYTGGLGADSSGNYNNFTATNLDANDQMVDSPTNSFCTLNPLDMTWSYPTGQPIGPPTLSEGNLKSTKTSGSSGYEQSRGTIAVDSGKWYFEMLLVNAGSSNHQAFGICTTSTDSLRWWGGAKDTQWTCQNDGTSMNGDGSDSGFLTYAAGDVMSCAFDVDAGKIWWAKNGTWGASGNPATGANARYTNVATSMAADGNPVAPFNVLYSSSASEFFNFGSDSSFAGAKTAQGNQDGNGKGDFYYEPPSGFLALCADNLSDPEIKLPGEHMDTALFTGTGSELEVSSLSFQPDFTWIKTRQLAYNHRVFDVVRGVTKELYPNDNDVEVTDAQSLKSFDSDGFTLGTSSGVNPSSSSNMVSWNWKAGGTAVTNDDGTQDTSVSANTTAGMSVVKFTGTGSASDTFGHGLSQAPELIILKNYDGSSNHNWSTWHEALGAQSVIYLDGTGAADIGTSSGRFSTLPTSSVFTAGSDTNVNENTVNFIGFCFHSVEGYSKVGKYVGNAGADGVFIYTGFRPAFLIAKNYGASGKPWVMYDDKRNTYNEMDNQLVANANTAQNTSEGRLDFVSNGIKWRIGDSYHNDGSFIYVAFAESPFKYSNAR